jgi:hypothetical protein
MFNAAGVLQRILFEESSSRNAEELGEALAAADVKVFRFLFFLFSLFLSRGIWRYCSGQCNWRNLESSLR